MVGFLCVSQLVAIELNAVNPINNTESIIIDGFVKDIPANDKRSFNNIIDEVLCLINNNRPIFINKLNENQIANPETFLNDFLGMLTGLKAKTKVNDILAELTKHKPTFNLIVPSVMSELFKAPFRTLRVLRERHKRN